MLDTDIWIHLKNDTEKLSGFQRKVEYIWDALGAEFYGLVDNSGSIGEDAVDMVYQESSDEWMCKVCYDEAT